MQHDGFTIAPGASIFETIFALARSTWQEYQRTGNGTLIERTHGLVIALAVIHNPYKWTDLVANIWEEITDPDRVGV